MKIRNVQSIDKAKLVVARNLSDHRRRLRTLTATLSWNILFTSNKIFKDSATLTIAVAGCARNPQLDIEVNGTTVSTLKMGNDASVYRSAIAGGYYQLKEIKFLAALLLQGNNKITLNMKVAKHGAGIMYDAIKLEAK